jgi:hypothetical protein
MDQPEVGGPPICCIFIVSGRHADRDRIAISSDGLKLPGFRAHESVRRRFEIVGLGPKPGKTDWNATTNRQAILPF